MANAVSPEVGDLPVKCELRMQQQTESHQGLLIGLHSARWLRTHRLVPSWLMMLL